MTTTNTVTTKTATGIEINAGKYAVVIDQNDHEGRDFIATFGRYDSRGTFCVSACFRSRSYKSMERAERFAKSWLARKAAEASAPRATLLADDRIVMEAR